jgi:hypothetical protein
MPRIRSVKHQFFLSLKVASVPRDARLLFIGLLTLADREGRLEDQPQRIRVQLFPYDEDISRDSVEKLLNSLEEGSLIQRYEAKGEEYIQIKGFTKHQHCHVNEPKSTLPAPTEKSTVRAPDKHDGGTVPTPEDSGGDGGLEIGSGIRRDGGVGEASASAAVASSASGEAKPKPSATKGKRKPPMLVDDAFIDELQADPTYAVFDVRFVAGKMARWCKQHGKQPTQNRLIGWLNKEDRPLTVKPVDTAKRDVGKNRSPLAMAPAVEVIEDEVHLTTDQIVELTNRIDHDNLNKEQIEAAVAEYKRHNAASQQATQ